MTIKQLQIPWRESVNKVDCDVYAMRHMEAYTIHGVNDWEYGLQKGDMVHLIQLHKSIVLALHCD